MSHPQAALLIAAHHAVDRRQSRRLDEPHVWHFTCADVCVEDSMNGAHSNRWSIAAAGVVLQIALGSVYAWSVFRIPLTTTYGWTIPEVTLTFELAILVLGVASFAGGLWMRRVGPRRVAMTAGICYGA